MTTHDFEQTEYCSGRVRLLSHPANDDERGLLLPFYFAQLPFSPCRAFTVSNVPAGTIRGGHRHNKGSQLLICIQGQIDILVRYQHEELNLTLEPASSALLIGAGAWCQQTYIEKGSVLLVFADEPFDPDNYTKDWS